MCDNYQEYLWKTGAYSAIVFVVRVQNNNMPGYKATCQRNRTQRFLLALEFYWPEIYRQFTFITAERDFLNFAWCISVLLSLLEWIQTCCCFFLTIRIGAKHQELRQKQARGIADYSTSPVGSPPYIDDDEIDPNYARVNHFREAYPAANVYRPSSPPVAENFRYPRDIPAIPGEREHLEGLYAKINKQHHPQTPADR